jgi:dephospho-CoA kinase
MAMQQPFRIGITGNMGTGKSTVGRYLQHLGYAVVCADELTQALWQHDPLLRTWALQAIGPEVLNAQGQLQKAVVAHAVFTTPALKHQLEALIHPAVREGIVAFFEAHAGDRLVFAQVPLLFEGGPTSTGLYDAVWVVSCTEAQQHQRLLQRGMSDEAIAQRLAHQWPLCEKEARATVVLHNTGNEAYLHQQVQQALQGLQGLQAH